MPYITTAERIGIEKGMLEGMQQGIQQGIQQGLKQGLLEAVPILLPPKWKDGGRWHDI